MPKVIAQLTTGLVVAGLIVWMMQDFNRGTLSTVLMAVGAGVLTFGIIWLADEEV